MGVPPPPLCNDDERGGKVGSKGDEGPTREELLAIVRDLRAFVSVQEERIARQGAAIAALQGRGKGAADRVAGGKAAATVVVPVGADYLVTFDGGALGNPGKGYGSYHIAGRDGMVAHQRLEFGDAVTNNQAEYRTLIGALEDLRERLGQEAGTTAVAIRGDSQLVVQQVGGRWKVKNAELQPLHRRAVELLGAFGRADVAWHGRNNSVRVLGH